MTTPHIILEAESVAAKIRSYEFRGRTTPDEIDAAVNGLRAQANHFFAGVGRSFSGREAIHQILTDALDSAQVRGLCARWSVARL